MVEKIHALTAQSMTWQDTTELVGQLKVVPPLSSLEARAMVSLPRR